MRQMLAGRREQVSSNQPAIWRGGIKRKHALVHTFYARASLVGEFCSASDDSVILRFSDLCNRRAGKDDAERSETIRLDSGGEGNGIAAGYSTIMRRFMKQRQVMSGVACKENRLVSTSHRLPIMNGNALFIQRKTRCG
jgi:hypothetical protein